MVLVENFIVILSDIRNNIDAPGNADFDFTRIKLGETEIRVNGNVKSQYAVGAEVYFGKAHVKAGGEGAGIAEELGGGGGGKDDFAMAGTSSELSLNEIKSLINKTIKNELGKI